MKIIVYTKAELRAADPEGVLREHGWKAYYAEQKEFTKKARIYVHVKGNEEQVIGPTPPYTQRGDSRACDFLWDAWNRHLLANYRVLLAKALEDLGVHGEDAYTMPYSRKAGCRCGCSPGFVAKSLKGCTIFVEGEVVDTEALGQPAASETAAA